MKILYFVGLLGVIGAATLAFMTRSTLLENRKTKDELNRRTVKIHDETTAINKLTSGVHKEWLDTKTTAKEEDIQTKKLKRDFDDAEKELADTKTKMEEIATKRKNMEQQIAEIAGKVGGSPEEVLAKVEALKGETDGLTKELDTLTAELTLNKGKENESVQLLARLRGLQEARRKAIAISGRTASVADVNNEFSFVSLNVGQNDGITPDTRLLVKRGGVRVARLNIVRIEGNHTIADIVLKSVEPGLQVEAGDQVIIDNSAS